MKNSLLLLILLITFSSGFSNTSIRITKTINWQSSPIVHNPTGNFPIKIWAFDGAAYNDLYPTLPMVSERSLVSSFGNATARLVNTSFESFDKEESEDDIYLSENISIHTKVLKDRNNYFLYFNFIPIRKTASGTFERLTSFEIVLDFEETPIATSRNDYTYTSELSDGEIYKIAVSETGIHKISYEFLKNEVGIDIDNINPNKIRILGNGGGMLPELIDDPRYDDLEEINIRIIGDEDNQFNSSDYILFYAEGPDKWYYDEETKKYNRPKNIYSDQNFYFIKIGSQNGLRVTSQSSISSTNYTTTSFDDYQRFEEDKFNLLNESLGAQGSGRNWYGDPFNPTRERSYNFSFPNIKTSDPVSLKVVFAGRSKSSSSVRVSVEGQEFSESFPNANFANNETSYAYNRLINQTFSASSDDIIITVTYPSVGDGTNIGWLDYIELNTRNNLNKISDQFIFRDHKTMDYNTSTFQVSNVNGNTLIWDITDPLKPLLQENTISGSNLSFGTSSQDILKEFIAFEPNGNYPSPENAGIIENQNIHAFEDIDLAIIYHKDFEEAALRLADHRRDFSGLEVATVEIEQVYNEFACGRKDATAIRDFAKMLYDRSPDKFNYLLLFGDGSFDFKDIINQGKNFIPPFETKESLNPIRAFPSDDFFALLTETEGADLIGALDIAVGRIPARTSFEANAVTQKIIDYDSSPSTLGDWRNRVTFVGDDKDGNTHINQADKLGEEIRNDHPVFNVNKIFLDAYQQVSTSGGSRFPKANEAINRDMFKGTLLMNYVGHGGSKGWAQERVLTNDDIENWTNASKLPLFVTATCSFTGYDEPSITTAGEQAMLKDNGGVIGLFTTTRAVYSNANNRLTNAVFDTIFQDMAQSPTPIGEILRVAKNANSADTLETNSRKFTLIGDPSMKLAIPKYNVATTKINGIDVSTGIIDTIQALQQVTVEGVVTDYNGNILTDFNGSVKPTIYDKIINVMTLGQDPRSPIKEFKLQQNIIFKGNASVTNGKFSFTFVVPKDINYEYGFGKISYYADNGNDTDARGYFDQFVIGGTDPNAIADNQGPLVEVFMNNEDFALGGITSPSPTLLVKLSDDNGINVVGNSIGHDLTGILDENTQETYILNDFYESELDDYTKGEVRFPLFNLSEGLHNIKVKAWDVSNNSGEGFTEFVVASNEKIALDYVLNYPNPFTTCTNFQFEHNIKDQGLEVQIQIFTVSGKIVKTIDEQLYTDGGRVGGIKWDGTDDYGGRLAKGVYLYKIKVRSDDLKTSESEFEKLVILK
jgi:peptidase C25-like protein